MTRDHIVEVLSAHESPLIIGVRQAGRIVVAHLQDPLNPEHLLRLIVDPDGPEGTLRICVWDIGQCPNARMLKQLAKASWRMVGSFALCSTDNVSWVCNWPGHLDDEGLHRLIDTAIKAAREGARIILECAMTEGGVSEVTAERVAHDVLDA